MLISSGNLSFLNWLTMLPAIFGFDDAALAPLFSTQTVRQAVARQLQQDKEQQQAAGVVGSERQAKEEEVESDQTTGP